MKLEKIHAKLFENKVALEPHIVIDNSWKFQKHTQMGSNKGGIFTDQQGKEFYIKFYRNPLQVESEFAATKVHELMGVKVLPINIAVNQNDEFTKYSGMSKGKIGIMSKFNPNLQILGRRFHEISATDADHLGKSYVAAILCENWDVIGLDVDNQVRDMASKELYSIDHGGSLNFRAQGGDKAFDEHNIKTKDSLRQYSPAKDVFDFVFEKFPEAESSAIRSLKNIQTGQVLDIFKVAGFTNAGKFTRTIMTRVHRLLEHYGHAVSQDEKDAVAKIKDTEGNENMN